MDRHHYSKRRPCATATSLRVSARTGSVLAKSGNAGTLLLWESFLRHDVPANAGKSSRISISFNFGVG